MYDKLIKAVQEHLSRHRRCSGFFLVSFQNGEDDVAAEIIRRLADCMSEEADEINRDAIGPCLATP